MPNKSEVVILTLTMQMLWWLGETTYAPVVLSSLATAQAFRSLNPVDPSVPLSNYYLV